MLANNRQLAARAFRVLSHTHVPEGEDINGLARAHGAYMREKNRGAYRREKNRVQALASGLSTRRIFAPPSECPAAKKRVLVDWGSG